MKITKSFLQNPMLPQMPETKPPSSVYRALSLLAGVVLALIVSGLVENPGACLSFATNLVTALAAIQFLAFGAISLTAVFALQMMAKKVDNMVDYVENLVAEGKEMVGKVWPFKKGTSGNYIYWLRKRHTTQIPTAHPPATIPVPPKFKKVRFQSTPTNIPVQRTPSLQRAVIPLPLCRSPGFRQAISRQHTPQTQVMAQVMENLRSGRGYQFVRPVSPLPHMAAMMQNAQTGVVFSTSGMTTNTQNARRTPFQARVQSMTPNRGSALFPAPPQFRSFISRCTMGAVGPFLKAIAGQLERDGNGRRQFANLTPYLPHQRAWMASYN